MAYLQPVQFMPLVRLPQTAIVGGKVRKSRTVSDDKPKRTAIPVQFLDAYGNLIPRPEYPTVDAVNQAIASKGFIKDSVKAYVDARLWEKYVAWQRWADSGFKRKARSGMPVETNNFKYQFTTK